MAWQSSREALDGRPVIEIESAHRRGSLVTLSGSASVYEGTVLVEALGEEGTEATFFSTATEGAPGRGLWQLTFELPMDTRFIRVRQEEMEETPRLVETSTVITIDASEL